MINKTKKSNIRIILNILIVIIYKLKHNNISNTNNKTNKN